jgi:Family of unknown function (DUF5522)/Cysteine-rich CWC
MQSYLRCRQKDINNMSGRIKICPRCKKEFTCNAENISLCACHQAPVSNETKSFLTKTFFNCVCNNCLLDLNRLVAKEKEYPFPGRGGDLIEGVHYYKEGEYRVFTEFYLLSRGNCCRSGCRHCPYGFDKRWAE